MGFDGSTVSFSFEAAARRAALDFVLSSGDETSAGEPPFSVGVAEGELDLFAEDGAHGELAWGRALARACLLARRGRAGEILVADDVGALVRGELLPSGVRRAREGSLVVRGARIDPLRPFRSDARAGLAFLRTASFVGEEPPIGAVAQTKAVLVRADPGAGGTRWLTELASFVPRSLVITPTGTPLEPLGALRRAVVRAGALAPSSRRQELVVPLAGLTRGEGIEASAAAGFVTSLLAGPAEIRKLSAILIDDVAAIDDATLEVCARVARDPKNAVGLVVRLDRASLVPSIFDGLSQVTAAALGPMSSDDARELVTRSMSVPTAPLLGSRWARLGQRLPLGVVEAVAHGVAGGEIVWDGEKARPRARRSGRGKDAEPAAWIRRRARDEAAPNKLVLGLLALLGGEVEPVLLARILEAAIEPLDDKAVSAELIRTRWLVESEDGWLSLPSRTHVVALADLLEESVITRLHAAAADVIEEDAGSLGRAVVAYHAERAGQLTRAARLLQSAGTRAGELGYAGSASRLHMLARRLDPNVENTVGRSRRPGGEPVVDPFAKLRIAPHDSEPPAVLRVPLRPVPPPDDGARDGASEVPSSSAIATRLGDLAKEALRTTDQATLEGLSAGLTTPSKAGERRDALSRIRRGDIGAALRVLRRTRAELPEHDHAQRCQTSLAIGVALAVAGRPQEALVEAMDALARARRQEDERAANACLAFLNRLYESVGRQGESPLDAR